jgi:hypothetical protein
MLSLQRFKVSLPPLQAFLDLVHQPLRFLLGVSQALEFLLRQSSPHAGDDSSEILPQSIAAARHFDAADAAALLRGRARPSSS